MTDPAIPGLSRHFITLSDRQLHYRRAGSGPALVLLAPPPFSSAILAPMIARWSRDFTVIALDLPGTGLSDPLAEPSLTGLAALLGDTLAALQIKRAGLWGRHGGAAAALALALAEPDRISGVVLEGLEPGRAEDRDFPDFSPVDDGSHLARLWAMLRDAEAFYPFHARSAEARVLATMPDAATLTARAIDLMRAGPDWAALPKACRKSDPGGMLDELRVPVTLVLNEARGQRRYERKLRRVAEQALLPLEVVADDMAADATALTFLKSTAADAGAPPAPDTAPLKGRLYRRYVDLPGGQLHCLASDAGDGPPLLIQHDAASASDIVAPIAEQLIGKRPLRLFDWPGNGESDRLIATDASVADYAEVMAAALAAEGLKEIDHYGMWGGGFVGLDLAHQRPGLVRKLVLSNVFFHAGDALKAMQDHYTPLVEPQWHGGHLMQAWHQMRDQAIWYPWFARDAAHVIPADPFIDPAMVQTRVFCLLRAGEMFRTAYQSHFVYPVVERLKAASVPVLLGSAAWDPNRDQTVAAHKQAPNTDYLDLGEDITGWGKAFLGWLDG